MRFKKIEPEAPLPDFRLAVLLIVDRELVLPDLEEIGSRNTVFIKESRELARELETAQVNGVLSLAGGVDVVAYRFELGLSDELVIKKRKENSIREIRFVENAAMVVGNVGRQPIEEATKKLNLDVSGDSR